MKPFLRFHAIGIAISLLIGAIIAAPPVIFRLSDAYQGVPMMKTNTEMHYIAQVQEVYDGDPWIRNPFFADLKSEPYLFPPLSPNIIAVFGKLLGLTLVDAVMLMRFFLTGMLAFLVYLFTTAISSRRLAGLIAAPLVLLGYNLLDPRAVIELLGGDVLLRELSFIDYGRPINPQVSSLFFFAYLLALWRVLHFRENRPAYMAVSALLLGASFYVYLFTWTFLFTLNAALFFVFLWKKDWEKVRSVVIISASAGIIGIPYLLHVRTVSEHPWYAESAARFGFVHSRTWAVSRVVVGAVALLALLWKKLTPGTRVFFAAAFAAALIAANEHVVTGKFIFNDHYHWYYATPLVLIFLAAVFVRFVDTAARSRATIRLAAAALIALVFYNGILIQIVSYQYARKEAVYEQRYEPVIAWLKNHAKATDTVLAPPALTRMIPALTPANVYYGGTAIYTLVPSKRLLHAYLVYQYLDGVPKEDASAYFNEHRAEIAAFVYGYTYAFQKDTCPSCFPEEVITQLSETYQSLTDENFLVYLTAYPVEYLAWDREENPDWRIDRFGLREAVRFGAISLFAVPVASSSAPK